jgi:DNA-binding GntR family transcriptional regulator
VISIVGWKANPSWRKEWNEHKAVLAAAKKGDAEGAAEWLRQYVADCLERIIVAIGE